MPVVRLSRRSEAAGGAGNVALNLASLGLQVTVGGYVGDDDAGRRLLGLLERAGVECRVVTASDARPTVTKTRIFGGRQQMLRVDDEVSTPAAGADQDTLSGLISPSLESRPAAVVLSDYDKGAVTPHLCQSLIAVARPLGIQVLIDPKGRDFRKYFGATAMTPNRSEFEAAARLGNLDGLDFRDAARRFRSELGLDFLAVTRGKNGVSLFDEVSDREFPATAREVFDVSGAGDTLIATLTAGLAAGLGRDDAVRLANVAAGMAVCRIGTSPVQCDELLAELNSGGYSRCPEKVIKLDGLLRLADGWRARSEQVVFTNGCFDLLHLGHVTLLATAGGMGHRLVVGMNTDRSVRALKGESRPVVAQADRARVVAGLASVDAVVLFDEETPLRLIEALRPDVLVKGADYAESQVVGADLVKAWGGRVVLVPLVEGRSTTRMLNREGV